MRGTDKRMQNLSETDQRLSSEWTKPTSSEGRRRDLYQVAVETEGNTLTFFTTALTDVSETVVPQNFAGDSYSRTKRINVDKNSSTQR